MYYETLKNISELNKKLENNCINFFKLFSNIKEYIH